MYIGQYTNMYIIHKFAVLLSYINVFKVEEVPAGNSVKDSSNTIKASNNGNDKSNWKAYCQRSSIPGLSYVVDDSLLMWMRIFWVVVILVLFVILIYATGTLTACVFSREKVYSSMTIVTNDSLTFPDIHICDSGFFSRKKLYGKHEK